MKTQLDELNEFLIKLGNTDGIGIRRKIVAIKKYLEKLING
jgi:hypothetical protein